jgi:hypothetical protein
MAKSLWSPLVHLAFTCLPRYAAVIDLSQPKEVLWSNLPKSEVRWSVKKVLRSGIEVHVASSKEEFDAFYGLLYETFKNHRTFVQA